MKNPSSLYERLMENPVGQLIWNQEQSILDTTELICAVMKETGVTRTELATRLGTSKGYVTQLLDGSTNMTIRTISDVFSVLGKRFVPHCAPLPVDSPLHLQFSFDLPAEEEAGVWSSLSPPLDVDADAWKALL